MSWQTYDNPPTENQVNYMQGLCDFLNIDYEEIKPPTFAEASELIDELVGEAGEMESWRTDIW